MLSIVALSSCATFHKKDKGEEAKEKSRIAINDFNNCIAKNVNELDDGYSDVNAIALALTNYCINEYDESINASSLLVDQNNKDIDMHANIAHTKEAKIKASIGTVLKYRHDNLSTRTNKPTVSQ